MNSGIESSNRETCLRPWVRAKSSQLHYRRDPSVVLPPLWWQWTDCQEIYCLLPFMFPCFCLSNPVVWFRGPIKSWVDSWGFAVMHQLASPYGQSMPRTFYITHLLLQPSGTDYQYILPGPALDWLVYSKYFGELIKYPKCPVHTESHPLFMQIDGSCPLLNIMPPNNLQLLLTG